MNGAHASLVLLVTALALGACTTPDELIDEILDGGLDGGGLPLPHVLGPDQCRTAEDCGPYPQGVPECAPPDATAFPGGVCGACLDAEDECATDEECGPGLVCRRSGPCGCGQLTLVCVEGCQSGEDCLTGQTCDADAHCVATVCAEDDECPSQFYCSLERCERTPCSIDADCDEGWCVNDLCFDEPGDCFENIPVP